MSSHGIFRVRDLVMDMFTGPLLLAHNKAAAVRMFAGVVNDAETDIGRHPSDYELFMFGTIDDESGKIKLYDVPERVARALDVLKDQDEVPSIVPKKARM